MVDLHNMKDYIVPFLLVIMIALYGIGKRKRAGNRINYCKVDYASSKNGSILIDKASPSLPKNDRLSELPDEILSHLIAYLSLRDVARIATLSKKWRKVSLSPRLDLDWRALSGTPRCYHSDDCELYKEAYVKGVDRVLRNYKDHDIISFRLQSCCLDNKYTAVSRWINFAAENKFLQSLSLQFVCRDGVPIDCQRKYNVFHVISGSFLSQFCYLKNLHLHSCIVRLENDIRLSKLLISLDLCDVILEGTQWQGFLSSLSTLESLSLRHSNLPKKVCVDDQLPHLNSLRIELCDLRELELSARNLKTFQFVFCDPVECSFSCASSLENVYIFPGRQDHTAGVILDSLAAKASKLKSLYVRGTNSLVQKLPSCRGFFFRSVLNFRLSIWTAANNRITQAVPHLLKSFPLLKKLEVEFPPWPDYETPERYEVLVPICHDSLKEVELSYFQERWIPVATFLLQSAIGLNCMVLTKSPRKEYSAAQGWCMTDDELSEKECEIIRKALVGKASSPHVQVTVGKVSL